MRSVVSTVSDKAAEAGIAMTLEADGDPGTFEADASALSAALVNLLENAVDACRADGSKKEHYVRVSVKGLPDAVEVRIEDNGIGMTEETRTKLFTLFFSSKGKGGTGIGLYVARPGGHAARRQDRGGFRQGRRQYLHRHHAAHSGEVTRVPKRTRRHRRIV